MLIRWVTQEDIPAWLELAEEMGPIFDSPSMAKDPSFYEFIQSKARKYEACIAIDRRTAKCFGIIAFSRTNNRISWFGVFAEHRGIGIGSKLLRCAIQQLDWSREITVETFRDGSEQGAAARKLYAKFGFQDVDKSLVDPQGNPRCKMACPAKTEKKGGSFHYHFTQYAQWTNIHNCPVCQDQTSDYPPVLIKELSHSWLECYPEAQGRLFGKCHLLSKKHSEHFYDLSKEDMTNFMEDVQKAARALHKATGAIKINYEIHGNSMPHLHVHLFPRYLDDDFPSAPIDYRCTEPSPYEDMGEFYWFVEKVRELLQ